jgi:hypothetical protein
VEPIVQTAREFLGAVIRGETARATDLLTPKAVQQIREGGKTFAPQGLETADFRIGQIRKPSETQALVQCFLTDTAATSPKSEEMCCMLRLIEGKWLVSGIAFQEAPNQPLFILDFEKPQDSGLGGQTASGQTPSGPPQTATDGVRTAQEPPIPVR